MKNKVNTILILIIILLITNCQNRNNTEVRKNRENNNYSKANHIVNNKNALFKKWLKDTLDFMSEKQIKNINYNVTHNIEITDDSLCISKISKYKITLNEFKKKEILPNEISHLIKILKRYKEFPTQKSILTFIAKTDYYPSLRQGSIFDFTYEIKDIIIQGRKTKKQYSYTRGWLSAKIEFNNYNLGKLDTIKTEFIWKSDSLIKHIINHNSVME